MGIVSHIANDNFRENFDKTFSKQEEELIVKTAYSLLDSSGKVTAKFYSLSEAMDYRDKYPRDGVSISTRDQVFQPTSEPGAKVRTYPWDSIQHKATKEEKVQPEIEGAAFKYKRKKLK